MTPLARATCALLLLTLVSGLSAQALPTAPAGLAIERVAILPAEPTSISIIPANFVGEFGPGLIVTTDGDPLDRTVPDIVYRVNPGNAGVGAVISLDGESDPVSMDWYSDIVFDRGLYISCNNRDGYLPRDQGGTVTRINVQMGTAVENLLAPTGTYSEPTTAAFPPPGSVYGDFLYVANATDSPHVLYTTSNSGAISTFQGLASNEPKTSLGFSRGGLFGNSLYTANRAGDIDTVDSFARTINTWATGVGGFGTPNFAPPGPFADHIYITSAGGAITRIDSMGVSSTWMTGFSTFSTDQMRDYIAFSEDGRFLYLADPGTRSIYRIGAPRLAASQPQGPGTIDIQLNGFRPNRNYYVAYSFDQLNFGLAEGLGPAFGLWISLAEISRQLSLPFPPVVGPLDANGDSSFTNPVQVIPPALSGFQLGMVAITFTGPPTAPIVSDSSNVVTLTLR